MAGHRSVAGRVVRRPCDLAGRGAELGLVSPPLGGDHGHGRRAGGTGLPCGPVRSAPIDLESATRIVLITYGEAFERLAPKLASSEYSGERYTLYVNAIFLEPGGGPGHLLLDRPALIRSVNFPRSKDDSLQAWITYEIAFEDTDGDGGLDENDAASLYVSDLHGGSFRRVLPEGWSILAHEPLDGRRIVVLALRSAERGDRRSLNEAPERAFFYDVQTGRAEPYTALDSLTARAARIVGH